MDFLPIFVNLTHRPVIVIGGGEVACRKVDLLLAANASVTLVSPHLHPYLADLHLQQKLTYICDDYQKKYLIGFSQAWITTNDSALNKTAYYDCQNLKILANVVDDPAHCDFITPSIIDRSPIQIAISSGGASPVLIRHLRETIEGVIAHNLGQLAHFAGQQREHIKNVLPTVDQRRKFWERFFRHPATEKALTDSELEGVFNDLLKEPEQPAGAIYLIQHGKETEQLTLQAIRLMQQAECVLYSSESDFVTLCRRDADKKRLPEHQLMIEAKVLSHEGVRCCVLTRSQSLSSQLGNCDNVIIATSSDFK
ncbi:NAD(P)-dependent oxidoreductase [Thaumasiovibrio sp. DFM-14]|uniref:precorrin-2 dehydrogenase/sirohydrochlorin ferrochelatase family protein n=1 Tax=Thaumasiovibrio sp. DFM-14 TaxID=3384792 RepID=UPI00399EFBDF